MLLDEPPSPKERGSTPQPSPSQGDPPSSKDRASTPEPSASQGESQPAGESKAPRPTQAKAHRSGWRMREDTANACPAAAVAGVTTLTHGVSSRDPRLPENVRAAASEAQGRGVGDGAPGVVDATPKVGDAAPRVGDAAPRVRDAAPGVAWEEAGNALGAARVAAEASRSARDVSASAISRTRKMRGKPGSQPRAHCAPTVSAPGPSGAGMSLPIFCRIAKASCQSDFCGTPLLGNPFLGTPSPGGSRKYIHQLTLPTCTHLGSPPTFLPSPEHRHVNSTRVLDNLILLDSICSASLPSVGLSRDVAALLS